MKISNWEGVVNALLSGHMIQPYLPIVAVVAVECVLFVLIALWRFNRQEF